MARVPYILFISIAIVLAGCAAGHNHGAGQVQRPPLNLQAALPPDQGFGPGPDRFGDSAPAPIGPEPTVFEDAGVVRITAVNGEYAPTHAAEVYVYPGDVVTLAADVFLGRERLRPQRHSADGFAWESSLHEICVVARGVDCLHQSHFQANSYGVSYYVPRDMPAQLRITVRAPGGAARSDSIVLRNAEFDGRPHAPRPVLDSLEDYPDQQFDPNALLAGKGTWIAIGNTRYFSPSAYVVPGEEEWAPYRHGYWSWDNARGVTWDSYDPWGRVTDHYGVWRHHATYGWVWLPFTDHHYQPHVVTIFEAGDDVGWYPYATGCDDFYRPAAAEGFDDGFWLGYGIGTQLASFHVGFAVVPRASFTAPNVIDVMIGQRLLAPGPAILPAIQVSITERRWFGHFSGDLPANRLVLERRLGHPLPVLDNPLVVSRGGARIFAPRSIYPVPAESRAWAEQIAKRTGPAPIGVVAHARGNVIDLVPPFQHHAGLVSPPVVRDGNGQARGVVTTGAPVDVDPRHLGAPGARSRFTTGGAPAKFMTYDPRQATPAATIPQGVPVVRGPQPAVPPVPAAPTATGPSRNAAPAPNTPPARNFGPNRPAAQTPAPVAPAPVASAPVRDQMPQRTPPAPVARDQAPARPAPPADVAPARPSAGTPTRDAAPVRASGPISRGARLDDAGVRGSSTPSPDSTNSNTNAGARRGGPGRH